MVYQKVMLDCVEFLYLLYSGYLPYKSHSHIEIIEGEKLVSLSISYEGFLIDLNKTTQHI